jgi:predicted aspartyl protease
MSKSKALSGLPLVSLLFCSLLLVTSNQASSADSNFDNGARLYKQGDYNGALRSFDSVTNGGTQPTVIYYQALCQQQLGNSIKALQLYRKVTTSFPSSQEAKLANQYLNQLTLGPSSRSSSSTSFSSARPSSANFVENLVRSSPVSNSYEQLPDSCGVPFHRAPGNHMLVNASIGGRPMEVMFDTGAASSYFGKNQLAGAKITATGRKGESTGVGGSVKIEEYIAEVKLGDITRTVPLMVAENSSITPLLGQTFFNPFRYDIDTSAGVIHFYKKGGHNSEGFDTMNVPFVQKGNELEVVVSINGHQTTAFFDTGAGLTMFPLTTLASMGIRVPSNATPVSIGGVGGAGIAFRFPVERVALGAVQKSNMEIVASPSCPIALIGQDFFKDKRFSIDNEAHLIKFVR